MSYNVQRLLQLGYQAATGERLPPGGRVVEAAEAASGLPLLLQGRGGNRRDWPRVAFEKVRLIPTKKSRNKYVLVKVLDISKIHEKNTVHII